MTLSRLLVTFTVASIVITAVACTGKAVNEDTRIGAEEFKQKVKESPGVVIDVRTKEEHIKGHLAITDYNSNLLNGDFEAHLDSLDKNKTYYLYCRTGNRSGQAAELMKKKGFEEVYNVGGYGDLMRNGFKTAD